MTKEEKDLLVKDLCARLPYGVKASTKVGGKIKISFVGYDTIIGEDGDSYDVSFITPYLFPLSSMTEEQKREYNFWKHEVFVCHYEYGDVVEEIELYDSPESFEYLIENHFDYRGLIEKGLAIDATGLNVY